MAFLRGLTDVNMKDSTLMIRRKVREYFTGPMEENTKVNGKMENRMAWEFILLHQVKLNRASGLKERE